MKNVEQYGQLPLDDVQKIAQRIYKTPTYVTPETSLVTLQLENRRVAFKPLTNPGHIVKVLHETLQLAPCEMYHTGDAYILKYRVHARGGSSFEYCVGATLWEACYPFILRCINKEVA